MQTKDFHLGDVLSITTGRLVSPRHMEGIYDILNWMSGESIFTHQIPRVTGEAARVLLAAHPRLAEVDAEVDLNPTNVAAWLEAQVARYGEMLPVPKMTSAEHERIDPMSELVEKVHPDKIVIV